MSLIHLLSMGRCLKKSEDQTGVYKLERNGSVPRFEPQSTLPATPTLPASRSLVTGQPSLFSRLVANPVEEEISVSAQEPSAATPASAVPKPAAVAPARPVALPLPIIPTTVRKENKWISRIKGWFGIHTPQPIERRVQIELSLDRVKVVRNDLNDSDLELVERKGPLAANTTPQSSFERRQTQSWMKATKRFFRPARTSVAAPKGRSPFARTQPAPELISRS